MHAVFDGLKVPRNSISDSLTTYWISINDSVMSRDLIAVTLCHGLSHGIVHHADLSHTVSWNVKTWSPPRSPITRGREDIIRSLCSWCMALKPGGVRGEFSMKDAVWTRPGGSFLVSDDDESLTSTFSNLLLQAYESSDVWFAILCDVDRACRIPPKWSPCMRVLNWNWPLISAWGSTLILTLATKPLLSTYLCKSLYSIALKNPIFL